MHDEQSGSNASDKHFAYRFRDHGDIVRGEFLERSDDGKLKNPDEPLLFELHRTETALAGVMRSTQANCPVEYGIDVTSCGQNLQATVEVDVQVGPDWTWVKSRIFTPSSALPAAP